MPRVVLLTGSETRHSFFRKFLGMCPEINLIKTYCESPIALEKIITGEGNNDLRTMHLMARTQAEEDFFGLFVASSIDQSNAETIVRGEINLEKHVNEIIKLNPDYLVSYGCSIIKSNLIQHFAGRFINLHLGLSPYYRGTGTNFWPLVNGEPQFVGATFMHIDEGIDTGKIIHQIRAKIVPFDTVHSIGNRLIKDACEVMGGILKVGLQDGAGDLPVFDKKKEKLYRNRDYTEASVVQLYRNFSEGMIENYLNKKAETDHLFPIQENQTYLL
jgi:folate-dependent phosphoribosylglycinamide formyltransferase PurN